MLVEDSSIEYRWSFIDARDEIYISCWVDCFGENNLQSW